MTNRSAKKRHLQNLSSPKRAYMSASIQTDTLPVRLALEARGVRVFSPDQLDLPGMSLPQITRKAMSDADIVVAVFDSIEVGSAFYELGFAQALKKPTVALIPKEAPIERLIALEIPYLRLDPSATDSVNFIVDQIMAAPHHGSGPRAVGGAKSKPIGARADELLERLRAPGKRVSESLLLEIITNAVKASGVTSVSGEGLSVKGDMGVDIAVWSDDLSPWVANPLPIELKLHLNSSQSLIASSIQAAKMAEGSGALWTLVIYLTSSIQLGASFLPHNVLVMQAEAFVNELREKSFGEIVRGLRNERVHGGR